MILFSSNLCPFVASHSPRVAPSWLPWIGSLSMFIPLFTGCKYIPNAAGFLPSTMQYNMLWHGYHHSKMIVANKITCPIKSQYIPLCSVSISSICYFFQLQWLPSHPVSCPATWALTRSAATHFRTYGDGSLIPLFSSLIVLNIPTTIVAKYGEDDCRLIV